MKVRLICQFIDGQGRPHAPGSVLETSAELPEDEFQSLVDSGGGETVDEGHAVNDIPPTAGTPLNLGT